MCYFSVRIGEIPVKDNDALLELFVHYLAIERRYSDETVKAYLQDLRKFEGYLKQTGEGDFKSVALIDVRLYLSFLDEEQMSRNSISRMLSSLRGFYSFL